MEQLVSMPKAKKEKNQNKNPPNKHDFLRGQCPWRLRQISGMHRNQIISVSSSSSDHLSILRLFAPEQLTNEAVAGRLTRIIIIILNIIITLSNILIIVILNNIANNVIHKSHPLTVSNSIKQH